MRYRSPSFLCIKINLLRTVQIGARIERIPFTAFSSTPSTSPPHAPLSTPISLLALLVSDPMDVSSSSLSLVSRAKTALHSAAAKAEKVLTEIKKSDRECDGQSRRGSRRSVEEEGVVSDASTEFLEQKSAGEEYDMRITSSPTELTIPPASVIRQLALAAECGKSVRSIKDLLTVDKDLSSFKEKTGLSFSVVKSIVLREKEDKLSSDFFGDEGINTLISTLFNSEDHIFQRVIGSSVTFPSTCLSKDIRGAPPESFVVRLSQIIGGFKCMQKMATFWCYVVDKLRGLWSEGLPIPHIPLEANPDLNSCLLHQQLQVINCCVARKRRRIAATESVDSVLKQANADSEGYSGDQLSYARISSGEYVLRLGADHPSEHLTMLETDEPIYFPVTQEGPVLTEELIKETEEFVLRTGSVGAGCSQLLSDMQAFKAANPGCVLEDFIRWHSPPDWKDMESDKHPFDLASNEDSSSRRGRLSTRMGTEGNLWHELWETAKPLPAVRQTPLFDEDLAVESILNTLEDISPSELFDQLFVSVLCSGFLIAGAKLPADSNLSKLLYECRDYVVATYQSGIPNESISDICKVYETVETILVHPEEAIVVMEQSEEAISQEPKSRFRRITLNFIRKDKQHRRKKSLKEEKKCEEKQSNVFSDVSDRSSDEEKKSEERPSNVFSSLFDKTLKEEKKAEDKQSNIFSHIFDKASKDEKKAQDKESKEENKSEEKHSNVFTQIFDKKTYLFSKKHMKSNSSLPAAASPAGVDEDDWAIV